METGRPVARQTIWKRLISTIALVTTILALVGCSIFGGLGGTPQITVQYDAVTYSDGDIIPLGDLSRGESGFFTYHIIIVNTGSVSAYVEYDVPESDLWHDAHPENSELIGSATGSTTMTGGETYNLDIYASMPSFRDTMLDSGIKSGMLELTYSNSSSDSPGATATILPCSWRSPGAPLDNHISCFYHYSDYMPEHEIERVVPDGHVYLIFELDGMERCVYDNESLEVKQRFTGAWISGMQKTYISIVSLKQSRMFVVRIKPGGAFPFLHIPLDRFAEKILPAAKFFGDGIRALRRELLTAGNARRLFRIAESWLRD